MPEHIQYEDEALFNPETHHESSDVPVKGLLWAVVVFIVFSIVSHFVVLFLYKALVKSERKRMEAPQTAVARPANADVPQNQPLLQPFPRNDGEGRTIPPQATTPVVDLIEMREAEAQALRNYGWVDKERGIVRIPIDEAKKRLAAQLAVQGQLGAATTPPMTVPPVEPQQAPPSGQPVPADTGAVPATNTGAHP
jgi:hypothetical protein